VIKYTKAQLRELVQAYLDSETSAGLIRYTPLYRCFINKNIFLKQAVIQYSKKYAKPQSTHRRIPIRFIKSCDLVYEELNNNSRKCISDPFYYVCKYRIARFRDLMFKVNPEDLPLYINTLELWILAQWRLKDGK